MARLLSILAISASALVHAQTLTDADAAYAQGELDRAVELYAAAIEGGGLEAAQTAHAHLRLGVLRASLGGPSDARADFEVALAIDPSLRAPEELGPDAGAIFAEVRGARAGVALRVSAEADGAVSAGSDVNLRVEIAGAPAGMVSSIRVSAGPAGTVPWIDRVAGTPPQITVPAQAWRGADALAVRISALDSHGNELAATSADVSTALATTPASAGVTTPGEDLFASPWFWIVGGVLLAGGITAAIIGILLATAENRIILDVTVMQ